MEAILYTGRNCNEVDEFAFCDSFRNPNGTVEECDCDGEQPLWVGVADGATGFNNSWAYPGDIVLRYDNGLRKVVRGQGW